MTVKKKENTSATRAFKRRGDGPKVVYDYLLNKIVNLHLTSGARIEERVIVEELGISRTPVRQAFMRMAAEGLIEWLPNHGARIPPLDIEEVRSFFEAYEFALQATVQLATRRRTRKDLEEIFRWRDAYEESGKNKDIQGLIETNKKLHMEIARAGHNHHMERLLEDLLVKSLRLDWFWYAMPINANLDDRIDISIREHHQLVSAIENRDFTLVRQLTREHIESFRRPLLEYLSQSEASEFEFVFSS